MAASRPASRGRCGRKLRTVSTGRFSQMVDQARADSMEEVRTEDRDRVFYKLSPGKKIIVMLGGPLMNLLIAFVLITGVITLYGLPQVAPKVGLISECVPTATPTVQAPHPTCAAGDPASPAKAAGFQENDRIIAVNGAPITTWEEVLCHSGQRWQADDLPRPAG